MPREDDLRKIVTGGRARGLSDDQIRALVARYDERMEPAPDVRRAGEASPRIPETMPTPPPVAGRGTQFNQQRAQENAVENLPMAASTAGGLVGSLLGPGGTIAGVGFGGMAGQAAQDALQGREPDAGRIIERGAWDTAGQAAGPLVGGGLKLGGKGAYKLGTALLPRTLKEAFPNIAEHGFREGIALTRRGATKADELMKASRADALGSVAAAQQAGAAPIQPMEVVRALRPVGTKIRTQEALGIRDNAMPNLVDRARMFISHNRGGIPLTQAQAMKEEAQDLAVQAYKARDKGAVINNLETLTNEAQGRGLRAALESRVKGLAEQNARTQGLIGVREGAEHAAGTGHILSRLGGAGVGLAVGSGGGALPAILTAGGGMLLTTPGGLTTLGVGAKKLAPLASHTPQAARLAALLAALLGQEEEDAGR